MQQNFWFSGDVDLDWRIDERTRSLGREGVAAARARLLALRPLGAETDVPRAA